MRSNPSRLWVCLGCLTFLITAAPRHKAQAAARRVASVVPGPDAVATLREDYLRSAFLLYQAAAAPPGNVVVAPHVAATSLAMLYGAAQGGSASELAQALNWRLTPQDTAVAHEVLQRTLVERAATDTNTVIQLASRLWLAADMQVESAYQAHMQRYFGAQAGVVDFAGHASDARLAINDWVAEHTHGLIPSLLGANAIDASTQLVQTSAMYLKANWQYPFDVAALDAPFHNADGTTSEVPMLESRSGAKYRYAEAPNYQAVEIFYEGAGLAMDIVLPRASAAKAFCWDAHAMQDLAQSLGGREVDLRMPKFDIASTQDLGAALKGLGVHALFDPEGADLSSMVRGKRVHVGAAVSKAKISVDEHGTLAAAATAIVLTPASAEPGEPVQLTVDRPFFFVVRDTGQNVPLLIGRVESL